MIVRAHHFAFEVADHDAAHGTLYYPGDPASLDAARLTGRLTPQRDGPCPLVVLLPGINVGPESYRWLATAFVEAGFTAVTYAALGALGPAGTGITPAIDPAALAPDVLGTQNPCPAIRPLLDRLADIDEHTDLHGAVDLSRVALVGHSAGGTVALHLSRPDWVPGLVAVAAFGAHTMTSTNLGHGEASVVPIAAEVPVLLAGGAVDAVIDQSRDRYTSAYGVHDPVGRTFHEAVGRDHHDSWLIELTEANHFTICHPVDTTSGRTFLEPDLRADDQTTRDLLNRLLVAFLRESTPDMTSTDDLATLVAGAGVSRWARR